MKLLGQDVSQALCSLSLMKAAEYDEYDIVTKTVEMVDKIWKKDQELWSNYFIEHDIIDQ